MRWVALGLLLLLPVALLWPGLFGGQRLWGYDEFVVNIPVKTAAQRALAAGEAPLWLPDLLGGMPHLASSNLQFLYPTELISSLPGMDIHASFAWDTALHIALAGVGMLCFLRSLGLSLAASLLGAVFFALSGSQVSGAYGGYRNFIKATALIPWAFWGAWVGWRDRSMPAWAVAGLALALQILAVAAQLFVYTATALAALGALRVWPSLMEARKNGHLAAVVRRLAPGPGLMALVAGLVAAPQLLPTLQYLPYSQRHDWTYKIFSTGSFGLSEAVTWIVPGYYGWSHPSYHGGQEVSFMTPYFGLLPWVLAAGAVLVAWKGRTLARAMAYLSAAAFVVSIGPATPLHGLLYRLPIYSGFRISSRALVLVSFAVCALAAVGWDALAGPARRRVVRIGWAVCAIFAGVAALAWFLAPGSAALGVGNMYVAAVLGATAETVAALRGLAQDSAVRSLGALALLGLLLGACDRRRLGPAVLAGFLVFHLWDQYGALKRFVRFQAAGEWSAFLGEMREALPPEEGQPWRFFSLAKNSPNDAILLGRESITGRQSMGLKSAARIVEAMESRSKDWLHLMGVRWFIIRELDAEGAVTRLAVHQDDGALPRARLLGRVRRVADDEEAFQLMADPGFDVRRNVALEADPGPLDASARGTVRWLARTPNSLRLEVESSGAAVLLLSNAWYPHWRCSLDGEPVPVLRANGALQAVVVKPGRQRLRFWYDPSLFYAGLACAALGLALLAGLALRSALGRGPRPGG